MRVSPEAMSAEKFRKWVVKIAKYVNFKGCDTVESVNKRILDTHSKQLSYLVKAGFAWRLMLEKWLNPHPDYKRILGIPDDDYESLVEENKEYEEKENLRVSFESFYKKMEKLNKEHRKIGKAELKLYKKEYKELMDKRKKLEG